MPDSQTMKIIIQAKDEASIALRKLADALSNVETKSKKANSAFDILRNGISKFKLGVSNLRSQLFTLKNAVLGAIAAFGTWKIYSYVKNATLLAARYRTLGITIEQLGKQAGYNSEQIAKFEKGLRSTGIAAIQTRSILARMIQSQLDLTKATELARVAQNAAVIAGLNSSETFSRMIHAIQANSVEILRTIGMNVSFEKSYKTLAKQLDISVSQMTEQQKVQARFNAVLKGGVQIAGAYEAAMTTAGKQMLSFARYVSDFRLEIGKAFEPTLAIIVAKATEAMKAFTEAVKDEAFQARLRDFAKIIGEQVQAAFMWLINHKESILNVIVEITRALGNVIVSLNYVLDKLITTQKDFERQNQKSLSKVASDLAKFISEREVLIKKLKDQNKILEGGFAEAFSRAQTQGKEKDFWLAKLDFGKTERKIKELDALIKKYNALSKGLVDKIEEDRKAIEPKEEKKPKTLFPSLASLQFKDYLKPKKEPLGSSILVSNFKRTQQQIALQLTKIQSLYDENIVSLKEYYEEKRRLAEENFSVEEKYLKKQAEKEKDPDKRLKVEDKIYALRKKFTAKTIQLGDEERKAFEKLAESKLEIDKGLLAARLQLAKSGSNYKEVSEIELKQLKISQQEKIKELVKAKATSDQIEQQKVINDRQTQQLIIDQAERTAERKLEIEKQFFEQRNDLYTGNSKTRQEDLDRIELRQLEFRQQEELRILKKGKADKDVIREQEVIHEKQTQLLIENQAKTARDKRLEIERTIQDAKLNLVDPDNIKAVFDSEMAVLEQQQADRVQSIKDAKLYEWDEVNKIEEANRIAQLERDQLHADQRLRIQQMYVDGVKGVLGNLNTLFGDLYEAGGRETKAFFHIQKAISVAQATMATYESAVQAYKSFAGLGPYGHALGTAAAAVAVASGLAKVAIIKSQSYARGGIIKGYSPSPKSDNININATAGEFMQPVDVVRHYSKRGMEAIRQKLIPREVIAQYANNITMPRPNYSHTFALGGGIPRTRETTGSAEKKADDKKVNIVNLIDPAVFQQYLASSTGEQQLMNVITANKYELKNILG